MKLLLSDGAVWTLHFHHHFLGDEETGNSHPYDVVTTARLHAGTCVHLGENDACTRAAFTGMSRCSRKDHFVKAFGRYQALTRLFKDNSKALGPICSQVLEAYWKLSPTQAKVRRVKQLYAQHAREVANANSHQRPSAAA